MKNTLVTTVSATALLLGVSASTAWAADLDLAAPPPAAAPGGFYVSAFGGANWLEDTDFLIDVGGGPVSVNNDYDTGFLVGGAFGYDFGAFAGGPFGVRLEGELSYRENDIDVHSVAGAALAGSDGDTSAFAGMVNVLFDLHLNSPFTVFAGGGIGAANVDFDGHSATAVGTVLDDDDTRFAYQFIGGVGYEITPAWVIDVQYRYFRVDNVDLTSNAGVAVSTDADYESHAVLGGIRWRF